MPLFQPGGQGVGQRRKIQQEVLGFHKLRCFAVDFRHWVNQVGGIQLVAAVVALIAARAVGTANRAGAFNVAVRQGATRGWRDSAHGCFFDHVAVVVQTTEQFLHHRVVVAGGGSSEQIVGQAQPCEVVHDLAVVAVCQFLHGHAFFFGLHQQRGPMLVRAGHHQDIRAGHSLVTGENIGGHAEPRHMSNVTGTVGVGPGNSSEHRLCHGFHFNLWRQATQELANN